MFFKCIPSKVRSFSIEIKQAPTEILENATRELIRVLNNCLSDTVESVRETSGSLLYDIIVQLSVEKILPVLSLLMPTGLTHVL